MAFCGCTNGPGTSLRVVEVWKYGPDFPHEATERDQSNLKVLAGVLSKKSNGGFWQKRYFVTNNGFLTYYPNGDPDSSPPLGAIDLAKVKSVGTFGVSGELQLTFEDDTVYALRASTLDNAVEWVEGLEERIGWARRRERPARRRTGGGMAVGTFSGMGQTKKRRSSVDRGLILGNDEEDGEAPVAPGAKPTTPMRRSSMMIGLRPVGASARQAFQPSTAGIAESDESERDEEEEEEETKERGERRRSSVDESSPGPWREGSVKKRKPQAGRDGKHKWDSRYLRLYRDNLYYYEDPGDAGVEGSHRNPRVPNRFEDVPPPNRCKDPSGVLPLRIIQQVHMASGGDNSGYQREFHVEVMPQPNLAVLERAHQAAERHWTEVQQAPRRRAESIASDESEPEAVAGAVDEGEILRARQELDTATEALEAARAAVEAHDRAGRAGRTTWGRSFVFRTRTEAGAEEAEDWVRTLQAALAHWRGVFEQRLARHLAHERGEAPRRTVIGAAPPAAASGGGSRSRNSSRNPSRQASPAAAGAPAGRSRSSTLDSDDTDPGHQAGDPEWLRAMVAAQDDEATLSLRAQEVVAEVNHQTEERLRELGLQEGDLAGEDEGAVLAAEAAARPNEPEPEGASRVALSICFVRDATRDLSDRMNICAARRARGIARALVMAHDSFVVQNTAFLVTSDSLSSEPLDRVLKLFNALETYLRQRWDGLQRLRIVLHREEKRSLRMLLNVRRDIVTQYVDGMRQQFMGFVNGVMTRLSNPAHEARMQRTKDGRLHTVAPADLFQAMDHQLHIAAQSDTPLLLRRLYSTVAAVLSYFGVQIYGLVATEWAERPKELQIERVIRLANDVKEMEQYLEEQTGRFDRSLEQEREERERNRRELLTGEEGEGGTLEEDDEDDLQGVSHDFERIRKELLKCGVQIVNIIADMVMDDLLTDSPDDPSVKAPFSVLFTDKWERGEVRAMETVARTVFDYFSDFRTWLYRDWFHRILGVLVERLVSEYLKRLVAVARSERNKRGIGALFSKAYRFTDLRRARIRADWEACNTLFNEFLDPEHMLGMSLLGDVKDVVAGDADEIEAAALRGAGNNPYYAAHYLLLARELLPLRADLDAKFCEHVLVQIESGVKLVGLRPGEGDEDLFILASADPIEWAPRAIAGRILDNLFPEGRAFAQQVIPVRDDPALDAPGPIPLRVGRSYTADDNVPMAREGAGGKPGHRQVVTMDISTFFGGAEEAGGAGGEVGGGRPQVVSWAHPGNGQRQNGGAPAAPPGPSFSALDINLDVDGEGNGAAAAGAGGGSGWAALHVPDNSNGSADRFFAASRPAAVSAPPPVAARAPASAPAPPPPQPQPQPRSRPPVVGLGGFRAGLDAEEGGSW